MAIAGSVAPVFRDGGYDATATYDFYHALIHNNRLCFCRQDGTIGHEPQEESDEYWFISLDGNIADAVTLNGKPESELSVDDSAKLGGKGASEYALKGLVQSVNTANTADEVENIISAWLTSVEGRTATYYILNINFSNYDIPIGLYKVVFSKNTDLYASIEAIGISAYNNGVQAKRSMNNGTWSKWDTNATTADLIKHNVTRHRGENANEISALYNSFHTNAKDDDYYKAIIFHNVSYDVLGGGVWYLEGVRITSTYGWQKATCYDVNKVITAYERSINNGVWTGWTKNTNAIDLANKLDKTGGTVSNGTIHPLAIMGNETMSFLQHINNTDGVLGYLGFIGADNAVILNSLGVNIGSILHTGNSQKVTITADAPSDTTALWVDTANNKVKVYKDGAWTAMA